MSVLISIVEYNVLRIVLEYIHFSRMVSMLGL